MRISLAFWRKENQNLQNVGEDLYNMFNYTSQEDCERTPFTRPEEFHCRVFSGLLEKLLAVFCEQEMVVRQFTM